MKYSIRGEGKGKVRGEKRRGGAREGRRARGEGEVKEREQRGDKDVGNGGKRS